jgi:hypothetical protein
MFRVIICGSREFDDYEFLRDKCDKILSRKAADPTEEIVIVSGCAKGADTLGERYASERGYQVLRYPAQWDKYGKSAGFRRNKEMAEVSNACIAFLSLTSENRGTKNMISTALKMNLLVREVKEED